MKNIFFLFGALSLLLFTAGSTQAATYYVAKTGCSDSYSGTSAQPWCTIQKAANTLVAGDTVYIKQGTYNEYFSPAHSGTAGNYITFAANPGDTVTLDGTGLSLNFAGLVNIDSLSYIKISGLRLSISRFYGIEVSYSNHITLEKNYIYKTWGSGIHVFYTDNITLDGNELDSIQTWTNPKSDDEEAVTFTHVGNFEIKNTYMHDCTRIGIDAKVGSTYGRIHNNTIKNTALGPDVNDLGSGIYLDAGSDAVRTDTGELVSNYEHDIDVYQNTVYDCYEGIIFATETASGKLENIHIYNNIVYGNGEGIGTFGYPGASKKNIYLVNNVAYGNEVGFYFPDPQLVNTVIRNNILSGNSLYQIYLEGTGGSYLTIDHNLVYGDSDITGGNAVTQDPRFVNAAGADFRLQGTSPAIDKGSSVNAPGADFDGNVRPQGAGYDIGAYEYVSGAATSSTTTTRTTTTMSSTTTSSTSTTRSTTTSSTARTTTTSSTTSTTLSRAEGDADGDGHVNYNDLIILAASYDAQQGDAGFDVRADFNGDGVVDYGDLIVLAANYGT